MSLKLDELDFVDLYVGDNFADVKVVPGAHSPRVELSPDYQDDVADLRRQCLALFAELGDAEFAIERDGVIYRVTIMPNLRLEHVCFIRRMAAEIRDFERLGLPRTFVEWALSEKRERLILVCGDQSAGKTSTAASLLVARLQKHGGVAVAIEDPPEMLLDGLHGSGRCIQITASSRWGGYREQLKHAMRAGTGTLLIGEIRDYETAHEAIQHANNGLLVLATIHGSTPTDALGRLLGYAQSGKGPAPHSLLASGLGAIIHQRLERVSHGGQTIVRALFKTLMVDGVEADGIRAKIRDGDLHLIQHEIDTQSGRSRWA